jgi:hypothetical protein
MSTQHSMMDLMSTKEKRTLRRWYAYAVAWGYWTDADGEATPGEHSGYEQQLPDMDGYLAVTAVSDNVFRNVMHLKRDKYVLAYDVMGKASQADYILGHEQELCKKSNLIKKLLREYFAEEAVVPFADELEHFDLDQPMSVPFEIIVNSALVLYAIAYLKPDDVTEFVQQIIAVKDQYENE